MNQQAKTNVEETQQALPAMNPTPVMEQFQNQQQASAGNGAVMPQGKRGKGYSEHTAAKKDSGGRNMRGTQDNACPSPSGRRVTHGIGGCPRFGRGEGGLWLTVGHGLRLRWRLSSGRETDDPMQQDLTEEGYPSILSKKFNKLAKVRFRHEPLCRHFFP